MLNLESETHLSDCRKKVFAFFIISVLLFAVYSNTLHSRFQFDDENNILQNRPLHLTEITLKGIQSTFFASPDGAGRLYRPVACLTFALNYYYGKDNPFGYHLVNLLIHIAAAVFLFLFIFNCLNLPRCKAKYGPNGYAIALLAAMLWAISPVQTQAVTYVVQRMASLAGMFYVMSMYFYLKARISRSTAVKTLHFSLCAVTWLLALGSKENAVLLPVSLFFFDLFLLQGISRDSIRKNSVIFFILMLIPITVALALEGPSVFHPSYDHRPFTMMERLLTQSRVLWFYISLLLYPMPHRLSIDHSISVSNGLLDPPTTLIAIVALLACIGVAFASAKRRPLIVYCVLFFFLNHTVESSILPLELAFEHRNYIPSMLFFLPIAVILVRGIDYLAYRKSMKLIFSAFIILVLIALGHSTYARNSAWKTEATLWLDTIRKNPDSSRAYHNLGRYYGRIGAFKKELAAYRKSLAVSRESLSEPHPKTHYNLAVLYLRYNQLDKAIAHLEKAIELRPAFPLAHNNLGAILVRKKKYQEAFDHFINALTYNESIPQAHHNLGVTLLKMGRSAEAVSELQKALDLAQNEPKYWLNLGIAYKYQDSYRRAAQQFQAALGKDPRFILAHLHLAETYRLMGYKGRASAVLKRALKTIGPETLFQETQELYGTSGVAELPQRQVILPLLGNALVDRGDEIKSMGEHLEKK